MMCLELLAVFDAFIAIHTAFHGYSGKGHICDEFIKLLGSRVLQEIG